MQKIEKARRLWRLYLTSDSWEGKAASLLPNVSLRALKTTVQSDSDPNVRIVAIRLIEALDDSRAIPFLLKLQNDSTPNYPSNFQVDEDEVALTVGETARAAIATLSKTVAARTN